MSIGAFIKDPDSVLDYTVDWSSWLADSESIQSVVWTVPNGLTENSTSNTANTATIWLSGGAANMSYKVSCRITTTSVPARVVERTFTLKVKDQ